MDSVKFLIDTNPKKIEMWIKELPDFVAGQLIVPAATRRNWKGKFAMDNSAYIRFNVGKFRSLLENNLEYADNCLFVSCPDVPGSARRTLELWKKRKEFIPYQYRIALVSQDGIEDLDIPWDEVDALFVGGGDPWKDSQCSQDVVRTAKILGKHVHVGRVNQLERYRRFEALGADTCDGSSIAIYDYKLRSLAYEFNNVNAYPLFEELHDVAQE
jgi:hypothetical protein